MLAFTGALVQSYGMHFDGKLNGMFYEKGVNPFEATPSAFATNPMGMAQILLFIGLTEGYTFPEGAWSGDMKREPGDLGYRVMRSADVMEEQQIKELKNGGAPRPFLCLVRVRSRSLTGRRPRTSSLAPWTRRGARGLPLIPTQAARRCSASWRSARRTSSRARSRSSSTRRALRLKLQ